MAWQSGLVDVTSPDDGHIRMLKHLVDFIRGSHVDTIVINNPGSGYVVGDVLTLSFGTTYGDSSHDCQIEVEATGSPVGAITQARMIQSGSYGVEGDILSGIGVTGGTGSGATFDLTMDHWATATVQAGGAGYAVGDVLTVVGGTLPSPGTAMTFRVQSVVGSPAAVATVKIITVGNYSLLPTNPVSTTGGSGTGCTLNITRIEWMIKDINYTDDQTNFEFIAEGVNLAGLNPFVGFRTGAPTGSGPVWQLMMATSYDNALPWQSQPGHSPAAAITDTSFGDSTRLPLHDGDIEFFFFVSPRRIIVNAHLGSTYELAYIGCFTPYQDDPSNKWPSPFILGGTSSSATTPFTTAFNSTHCPIIQHLGQNGFFMRDPIGVWREPSAGVGSSTAAAPWKVYPACINVQNEELAFNINNGSGTISYGVPSAGQPSLTQMSEHWFSDLDATTYAGYASFGAGNRTYLCEPFLMYQDETGVAQLLGELEGIFAVPGRGMIVEDLILDQGGRTLQVFSIINSTNLEDFYAIARD